MSENSQIFLKKNYIIIKKGGWDDAERQKICMVYGI